MAPHRPVLKERGKVLARRAVEGLKLLFTPLAAAFLLFFGWRARDVLAMIFGHANPGYLALSALLWVILHFMAPVIPTLIFRACGSEMRYAKAFQIYARRLPGRYLPGGIWHTVGRVVDFHDHGVKPRHLTAYVFLETLFPAMVTFLLGGMGLGLLHGLQGWGLIGTAAAAGAAAALVVTPVLINGRFIKAPERLPLKAYLTAVAVLCLYWVIAAVAFVCYVGAFPLAASGVSGLAVGITYLFSWGVGYIAVFAPQGIGIFELVAGKLLSAPLSLGGLAALLAGFRLVILVADVIVWSVSRLR